MGEKSRCDSSTGYRCGGYIQVGQQYRIQVWGRNPEGTVVQDTGVGEKSRSDSSVTGYRCGGDIQVGQ